MRNAEAKTIDPEGDLCQAVPSFGYAEAGRDSVLSMLSGHETRAHSRLSIATSQENDDHRHICREDVTAEQLHQSSGCAQQVNYRPSVKTCDDASPGAVEATEKPSNHEQREEQISSLPGLHPHVSRLLPELNTAC